MYVAFMQFPRPAYRLARPPISHDGSLSATFAATWVTRHRESVLGIRPLLTYGADKDDGQAKH